LIFQSHTSISSYFPWPVHHIESLKAFIIAPFKDEPDPEQCGLDPLPGPLLASPLHQSVPCPTAAAAAPPAGVAGLVVGVVAGHSKG